MGRPSKWHCHQSRKEEQQFSGEFSLALLTGVIAICRVHEQLSSFPKVQRVLLENLDQTSIEQSLRDSGFHHGVVSQTPSS